MKYLPTGVLIFVAFFQASAQQQMTVFTNTKKVGNNIYSGSEIFADEISFPGTIQDQYLDTLSDRWTILLRNTGKYGTNAVTGNILVYDNNSRKIKWTKKINFSIDKILQQNDIIIRNKGNKSYCLDPLNGNRRWKIKEEIYFLSLKNNIALGYWIPYSNNNKEMMTGINLTTGKALWNRYISGEYGWNGIISLNDTLILLEAAGLHEINLKNGFGWDYNTLTGKKDYTASIIAGTAGLFLGILTGYYFVPVGYNLVTGIVSNVLFNDNNVYFASKEKLTKLNEDGHLAWSFTLPVKEMSNSTIFMKDNLLYLINRGFAYSGSVPIKFGSPFIARYHPETGNQDFLDLFTEKKDPIVDYKQENDSILLVFQDRISVFSIPDHKIVSELDIDTDSLGYLQSIAGEKEFSVSDSGFCHNLQTTCPDCLFLQSSKNKLLRIDREFDSLSLVDQTELFIEKKQFGKYEILSAEKNSIILNGSGEIIDRLNITGSVIPRKSKLYIIDNHSINAIDMEQLSGS